MNKKKKKNKNNKNLGNRSGKIHQTLLLSYLTQ